MNDNQLTGDVPKFLANLPNLEYLFGFPFYYIAVFYSRLPIGPWEKIISPHLSHNMSKRKQNDTSDLFSLITIPLSNFIDFTLATGKANRLTINSSGVPKE